MCSFLRALSGMASCTACAGSRDAGCRLSQRTTDSLTGQLQLGASVIGFGAWKAANDTLG